MCKRGDVIDMELPFVGEFRFGTAAVDKCMVSLIKALNDGGIFTRGCCCGHGDTTGYVHLDDGRYLAVFPTRRAFRKVHPG